MLIGLKDGERIDPELGRNIADGGERITFLEDAVENHMNAAVAELAIDGLAVVPFTAHYRFHRILSREVRAAVFDRCLSYSVIHNYNTISGRQALFLFFWSAQIGRRSREQSRGTEVTIALPVPNGNAVAEVFQLDACKNG